MDKKPFGQCAPKLARVVRHYIINPETSMGKQEGWTSGIGTLPTVSPSVVRRWKGDGCGGEVGWGTRGLRGESEFSLSSVMTVGEDLQGISFMQPLNKWELRTCCFIFKRPCAGSFILGFSLFFFKQLH